MRLKRWVRLTFLPVVKPGPSGAGGFQAWGWGGCSILRMFRTSQVFWILGREAMESHRLFVGHFGEIQAMDTSDLHRNRRSICLDKHGNMLNAWYNGPVLNFQGLET